MKIRPLARRDYLACLQEMRDFTATRNQFTEDELWLVEHEPVFTQGLAGLSEHVLSPGDIPCVRTERGGQVTYHGPGQVLAYLLVDLRRSGLLVREMIAKMESAVIDTLSLYGIEAMRKPGAPGIYVKKFAHTSSGTGGMAVSVQPHIATPGPKISALGLKVSRGCTFHGLALNVAMDLEPFSRINPCGYEGLEVSDIRSELIKQQNCAASSPKNDEALFQSCAENLARALVRHLTK